MESLRRNQRRIAHFRTNLTNAHELAIKERFEEMASFAGKFDSAKQDWTTPDEVFQPLHDEFGFTLDAAASKENARAPVYFDQVLDGLRQDWGQHVVWLNPPYGDGAAKMSDWVRKSYAASRAGATVVLLIPARTNTSWFQDICLRYAEVRFIRGRPKFGDAEHGLPQPLCIVIFRPAAGGPVGSYRPAPKTQPMTIGLFAEVEE
jgi:phage N-6-adenine-methyltransferase